MNSTETTLLLKEVHLMRKATERIADATERIGEKLERPKGEPRDPLSDVDELDNPEDMDAFRERLNKNAKKRKEKTKGVRVEEVDDGTRP